MSVIYANGQLTKITATGTTDDYDVPGAPGTDRWTGSVGITVRERLLEAISPGRVDEVKETRLELPYDVGKLVARGDTLTFTYEDTEQTATAGTLIRAQLTGRVRVVLEDR